MAGDEDVAEKLRAKAALLGDFFHRLRAHVEARFGYGCVDDRLPARLIFSPEACFDWFEGEVRGGTKRQQFGTFFALDSGPYCLHVQVGTHNLHIGVVKTRAVGERLVIERMTAFDYARLDARLKPRLPSGVTLARRGWGHVWASVDCGDFREPASDVLDFDTGALARRVLDPLATALRGFAADRAWAWQAFDRRQFFRFFVDGRFHKKYAGWTGYEANEAGSVQGMLDAFAFIVENLDRAGSLDVPYLLELHRRIMDGVKTKNPKSSPGQTRFREAGFLFYSRNSTLASLAEIFELRRGDGTPVFHDAGFDRSTDDLDYVEAHEGIKVGGKLRFRPWYPPLSKADRKLAEAADGSPAFLKLKAEIQAKFHAKMQECIDTYNRMMAAAQRDIDRITAIARIARDLELLHPFPDGNGRAFPVALASQLALYHGFPPPIFRDPNIDAELSYAEFTAEMISAMTNTVTLLKSPEAVLYDYGIHEATADEVDAFAAKATELSARLDLLDTDRGDSIFATADYAAWVTGGRWVGYRPGLRFSNAGSHRTFRPGCLYFGLAVPDWKKEGKSVDEELARVIEKGAAALVLDFPVEPGHFPVPVLVVDKLDAALKALAHRTRQDVGCRTVLVTGTEGKTGAKCQLHHVLRRQTEVHAVLNSANTEGPVLFSLMNLKATTQVEVNEVSVGSDEALRVERARLVSPDVCLFTNIGPNHMDMHKTIDNVIEAKASVVEGLPQGGTAIVNADNVYCDRLIAAMRRRRPDVVIRRYGHAAEADGRLLEAEFDEPAMTWRVKAWIDGQGIDYTVPLLQNYAPLASVGVLLTARLLGFDVARAAADYADFTPFETMGRLIRLHLEPSGEALFYDQSRRGGMHGMRSAFDDLKRLHVPGRTIALVGGISIKKDSAWTRQAHAELAELINASRIDRLYTTGNFMDTVHAGLRHPERLIRHADEIEELASALAGELRDGDLLFIIGSAYLYLGRVAELLLKRLRHSIVTSPAAESAPCP